MIGTSVDWVPPQNNGIQCKVFTAEAEGTIIQDNVLKGKQVLMIANHGDNQVYLKGFEFDPDTGTISNYYFDISEKHTIYYI